MSYHNAYLYYWELREEDFVWNRVRLLNDGWPAMMLLPKAEDFIPGEYANSCKTRGCLMGWAYAAFGVRFSEACWGSKGKEREHNDKRDVPDKTQVRQERLARRFAVSVLKEAGCPRGDNGVEDKFDEKLEALDGPFAKKIAHAWRVVAWRRGYDVKASEPGWKP